MGNDHIGPPYVQTDTTENMAFQQLHWRKDVRKSQHFRLTISPHAAPPLKIVVVEAMLGYEASNFKSLKSVKLIRA